MPDLRVNLQTKQSFKGNEVNDKNGWPEDLCDQSSPLKMAVTKGQNGKQWNIDPTSTGGQDQLSVAEGRPNGGATNDKQGGHGNKWKTSQQNAEDHHLTEGD